MKETKFSVIIPHYNIPERLERLLLTLPLDHEDVQVIVVDDRSDEQTEKLLDIKSVYQKKGVEFYRNNSGIKGPGTCRNIGIKHAVGKWLIFADADDYFTDDMYEIISENYSSDADIIYFCPKSTDEVSGEESDRHLPYVRLIKAYLEKPSRENELSLRFQVISPCSKMIKRDIVEKYNVYFGTTIVAQDAVFITKLCCFADKIQADAREIYVIVKRSDSLAVGFDREKQKVRTRIFVERCKYLKRNLSPEEYRILNMNGTNRIIGLIAAGYPMKDILEVAFTYAINGIRPVDFSMINPKTAIGTFFRLRTDAKRK